MSPLGWILVFLLMNVVLAFQRAALTIWGIAYFVFLLLVSVFSHISIVGLSSLWVLSLLLFGFLLIKPVRQRFFTQKILSFYRKAMPTLSKTEKEALAAGGVGWEGALFTGMPDWNQLQKIKRVKLSQEESEFIEGPVAELCGLINNWQINHELHEIPDNIWQHLKKHGFFGLIIPKEYGGKEFSALAHSQIITKIASVSVAVGTVVSVPNSLGPAELLLEYGTDSQKKYYLPRLAQGEEIPCFALTSPIAGSDASSIEDHGVVCKKIIEGKEVIGILLNWDKRYITLSPVATLIGLAFKLYDPEHLLGGKEDIGITCALIPKATPGVVTGRRHFPLCSHFPNGPTQGKDVFIPLDFIIGGVKMVGAGWRMLMECLAAGRSISLPAMVTGGAKRAVYTAGAYARIRRQFNTYIGAFGGIQEALARIGGYTYLMEALRLFSVCNIDNGIKSAVASATCKYHTTEYARTIVNDAMDIHGGKGICMGPHNYVAQSYIESPISITVEGANILTRSMIIFGQGAIRCHPYLLKEMQAAEESDKKRALENFDQILFEHLGMLISNKVRAFCLALTSARLASAPKNELKRYYQQLSRFSAAFSLLADISLITIGSKLKRKEHLSARLGDMLSLLYMGSAVLKYYELESNFEAEPVMRWAMTHIFFRLQNTMDEFLLNFPHRWLAFLLKGVIFPLGKWFKTPRDRLTRQVAELLLEPSTVRERLTQHLYIQQGQGSNPIFDIEQALVSAIYAEPLLKRLQEAKRNKIINGMEFSDTVKAAVEAKLLSLSEGEQLLKANQLRMKVIHVDDFSMQDFIRA